MPLRVIYGHSSDKMRAKRGAAMLGHEVTAGTRAQISAALTGRKDSPETRAKKIASRKHGAESETWRGTEISYNGAHNRARKTLPMECAMRSDGSCKGRFEVAFRQDAPTEWVKSHPAKGLYYAGIDIEAGYRRLCASHHRRYDGISPQH